MELNLETGQDLFLSTIGVIGILGWVGFCIVASMWLSSFYILNTWWSSHKIIPEKTKAKSNYFLCTLHQHAMRYYRLWIYACNTVLALATLIFSLFAISVLVDPRISLLSGVELYQPTFLYAYVALLLQCGVLQAIGCIGALRLHQKLLNTYWTLLLVLMIGDIAVGLVWAFRLDRIKSNLRPNLKQRLNSQYGNDTHFTQIWDWVQTNDMCCGVDGPTDFLRFNDSSSNHFDHGLPFDISTGLHHPKLPSSCCVFTISEHFPATVSPSNVLKNNLDWPDSKNQQSSHKTNISSTSQQHQQQQQRNNRVMYPHYPNSNFTMHLSSFSSGVGTHNRRKILHSTRKHIDTKNPDPSQHQHRFNVQTTTESSNRRSSTPYGVCGLPSDLLAKHKNNIYIKVSDTIIDNYSFEGSGSGGSSQFGSSEEANTASPENSGSASSSSSSSTTTSTSSVLESTWSPVFSEPSKTASKFTTPSPIFESGSTSTIPPFVLVAMTLNTEGCGDKIHEWVDHASDVLFVIGFCIIVFLKGCFVAILRYEIKEMIQKIKLLNGEDDGRQAAMNELIGLTSMYEGSHHDDENAEREGLMASSGCARGGGGDTTITNIDDLESDRRKDSVISRDHHNCVVGNNIGNNRRVSGPHVTVVGNHINNCNSGASGSNNSSTPPTGTTAAAGSGPSHNRISVRQETDIDEDFDSGSALLGKPRTEDPANINRKFRNENGGRSLPRNGNNNTTGLGGVTGSASAPIPIESMAKA